MSDYVYSRIEAKIDRLLEAAGIDFEEETRKPVQPRELSEAEKQARANAPATPTADQLQRVRPDQPSEELSPRAVPPPETPTPPPPSQETDDARRTDTDNTTMQPAPKSSPSPKPAQKE